MLEWVTGESGEYNRLGTVTEADLTDRLRATRGRLWIDDGMNGQAPGKPDLFRETIRPYLGFASMRPAARAVECRKLSVRSLLDHPPVGLPEKARPTRSIPSSAQRLFKKHTVMNKHRPNYLASVRSKASDKRQQLPPQPR